MESSRAFQGRAQATRGLTAMALLSLVVVASADRALLASRPGGPGALHAIAVTGANYWVTNGNGTFTYSPYSPAGDPNTAFDAANTALGASALVVTSATPINVLQGVANYNSFGITNVVFPSKSLGIAVGAAGATTAVANNAEVSANIVLTIDGGLTWMAATGLPTVKVAAATTAAPFYPAVTPGDLQKVYCSSKSTCWAVGSSIASIETFVTVSAYPATGTSTFAAPATSPGPSTAVVYATTNGGTVWTAVPTFFTVAQATAAVAAGPSAVTKLYAATVPGGLYSISGDAAGKNIYAVGAPGSTSTGSAAFAAAVVPTILYSGNSGATWAMQTAPALSGGVTYTLFDVAVQKGSTAYAVGGTMTAGSNEASGTAAIGPIGSCAVNYGSNGGCNGQIIKTTNGGFSWVQAVFPGNDGKNAPAFTSVAVNGPMVWVGGFVRQDVHYPTPAAAGSKGQGYTVLVSLDGGVTFNGAAAGYSTFPAGFVTSMATEPQTAFDGGVYASSAYTSNPTYDATVKDVTGIMWDNSKRGYIFGNGFIMGTQDAGKTWAYETPNGITTGTTALTTTVYTMANVPTTY